MVLCSSETLSVFSMPVNQESSTKTTVEHSGQTVLVTGASRGIGASICHHLAERGWSIIMNYRSNTQAAEELRKRLSERGANIAAIPADVSDEESVISMFRKIADEFGTIDALVNNAGVATPRALSEVDSHHLDHIFKTNVFGTIYCTREAARTFNKNASVVNIASIAGLRPRSGLAAYAASKAAVISLTQSFAQELGRQGVRVNAVAPGLIATEMSARFFVSEEASQRRLQNTPLGRNGQPADVARAVCWLLSQEARWITGQVVSVDGGYPF
jgi:3-oxoacyl-[acyl-carrier protein] reductase